MLPYLSMIWKYESVLVTKIPRILFFDIYDPNKITAVMVIFFFSLDP